MAMGNVIKSTLLASLLSFVLVVAGCMMPEEYGKAQEQMAAGNLEQALGLYESALAKTQDTESKNTIQTAFDQAKAKWADAKLQEANFLYEKEGKPTLGSIQAALAVVQAGMKYDDGRLAAAAAKYEADLQKASGSIKEMADQALKLSKEGKYGQALGLLKEARALNPSNQEIANSYEVVRNNLVEELNAALSSKDWPKADALLKDLEKYEPEHPRAKSARQEMDVQALEDTKARIAAMREAGQWYKAYLFILASPYKAGLEAELADIRTAGGQAYAALASQAMKDQRPFDAYVASVKALELAPGDAEAFGLNRQSQDIVDARIQRHVAVSAFDAPTNDPDAGKQFSDDLISYLFRLLPYGISVVERQKIDLALQEKQGDVSEAGVFLGVDLIIIGNVSLLTVDEQNQEMTGRAKIKVGTETRANPLYQEMMARYGNNPDTWPQKVPPTISEGRFELVPYRKGKGVLMGFINVAVRIFDVDRGSILYTNVFKHQKRAEDAFQEPVPDADPPVNEDPRELPTETEIKAQLREAVIEKIAKVVIDRFAERERQFLVQAEFHISRREMGPAVEELAKGHLYAIRAGLAPDNQSVQKINKLIVELTE